MWRQSCYVTGVQVRTTADPDFRAQREGGIEGGRDGGTEGGREGGREGGGMFIAQQPQGNRGEGEGQAVATAASFSRPGTTDPGFDERERRSGFP